MRKAPKMKHKLRPNKTREDDDMFESYLNSSDEEELEKVSPGPGSYLGSTHASSF